MRSIEHTRKANNQKGFTLIELAIVLVIVGVLLGGFIGSFTSRIESSRYAESRKNLEDIKAALIAYAYTEGVLPCPDDLKDTDADGLSNGDGLSEPACTAAGEDTGSMPWVTLAMGATDAWNNRYEYWVESDFSDTATPFDLTTTGGGEVRTRSNDGTTTPLLANRIVAVIYSRGKNGYEGTGLNRIFKSDIPAANLDEVENGNGDNVFISREISKQGVSSDGGEFDDLLIWISEYELKAKMVEAGVLP